MDCTNIKQADNSVRYQNRGCSGGFLDDTMLYLTENALFRESSYPFKGKETKCMTLNAFNGKSGEREWARLSSYQRRDFVRADELRRLLDEAPVVASVMGGSQIFRNYAGGIIDN